MNPDGQKKKLILTGAGGRMGRAISRRFLDDGIVEYVGAVDPVAVGQNAGVLSGAGSEGPVIVNSVDELPADLNADYLLDFSIAEATRKTVEPCLRRGWDYIIGATGLAEEDYMWLSKLSRYNERRVVIVPNFTLGVNLMLRILKDACKVYKNAEIIELHHDKKIDAPSGTAIHTSHLISQNMKPDIPPGAKDESRGKFVENIPVHAIRLPGLLAHQEVIFGGPGEVFTIRHDTTDRDAFLNGIYLAIENLEKLEPGLTVGLDWVF